MADPIIEKALALKKEIETDTPPEFQAKVNRHMQDMMRIILGAVQPASDDRKRR